MSLVLYVEKGDEEQSVYLGDSRPGDREWRQVLRTVEKMGWSCTQVRELYGDDEILHWDSHDGWYSWESVRRQAQQIRDAMFAY